VPQCFSSPSLPRFFRWSRFGRMLCPVSTAHGSGRLGDHPAAVSFIHPFQNRHTTLRGRQRAYQHRILGEVPQEEAIALQATSFCGKLGRSPAERRRP
jgi:hypothetical protein